MRCAVCGEAYYYGNYYEPPERCLCGENAPEIENWRQRLACIAWWTLEKVGCFSSWYWGRVQKASNWLLRAS